MAEPFDKPVTTVHALVFWLVSYGIVWALLSDASGWIFGFLSVASATALALRVHLKPWTVRPLYLPEFVVFFFYFAVSGALDVARRALLPSRPVSPRWVRYRFRERDPGLRLVASIVIGLFPGTLASHIEGDELCIHVIDARMDWQASAARFETQLARLLGRSDNGHSAWPG